MRDKLDLHSRLQAEGPARARAMLAEFMSSGAVVARFGKPIEWSGE
jgi:hypothetical protein